MDKQSNNKLGNKKRSLRKGACKNKNKNQKSESVIFHIAQLLISSTWRDIIQVSSKCAGLLFLGFAESAAKEDLLWSQLEDVAAT